MYIFISLLTILLSALVIYAFVSYNNLIHLSLNKDNALDDIQENMETLMQLTKKIHTNSGADKQIKQSYSIWKNAKVSKEKIRAWNMLLDTLTRREIKTSPEFQKLQEKTLTPRRYFNHNTKQLNERIATFPGSAISSFLGYKKEIFFSLSDTEKKGENTDVKW